MTDQMNLSPMDGLLRVYVAGYVECYERGLW